MLQLTLLVVILSCLRVAESTVQGCSSSFGHTNHHVRREVHMLWLQGEVKDTFLLQRTLLKLTSMRLLNQPLLAFPSLTSHLLSVFSRWLT